MRDGIKLSADVYRPDAPGRFPCLLMRTYWDNANAGKVRQAMFFAERGYAVALVDVRGRFDSGGDWEPYVNEPRDGYDTQQWLGSQPWCNGKVGTFGASYDGFTQLMPAPLHSSYLKCMVPVICQQTNFGHLYNDGVMQLNVVFTAGLFFNGRTLQPMLAQAYGGSLQVLNYYDLFRRLPLMTAVDDVVDAPYIKTWMRHDRYDDYWKSYGIKEKYGEITAPAYFVTGWYDNLLHETWRNFIGFRNQGATEQVRRNTKIIVGPWTHAINAQGPNWDADFGENTHIELNGLHLRWFDYWLKGTPNGTDTDPPIRIFVMGENRWRSESEWPLARTQWISYSLASSGRANSLYGDGVLSDQEIPQSAATQDRFVYDPNRPVPTLGGSISTHPDLQGPRDRRPVERRDDVLIYTSAPLAVDTEVTGPVELKLYAASSAVDTDFTATLADVYPDGRAVLIAEGVRGARYRESLEHPSLIEPGRVYPYTISLWETSNVFKAGHRIRLEISSSNFPRFARNQNTGEAFGTSSRIVTAQQSIFHSRQYPSRLVLPIIRSPIHAGSAQ